MTLVKTWYTTANRVFDDTSTATRTASSCLFALKAFMKGEITGTNGTGGAPPSSSYWTCSGSSDSATAGLDGTDRLGATYNAAKWVRAAAGVAHTWIVLKSPTTMQDQPWYVCIDWGTATDQTFNISVSHNAFTGGSTTAKPTATTESSYAGATFYESTTTASKAHFVTDADGNFWFFASRNGSNLVQTVVTFQNLTDTRSSGDAGRCILFQAFLATGIGAPDMSGTDYSARGVAIDGTTAAAATILLLLKPVFTGSSFTSVAATVNANDSKVDALPFGYIYDITTGKKGMRGRIPDLWYIATQVAIGANDPNAAGVTRTRIGTILIPCSVSLSL